jgi:iron complex outermembrane recepter protein
MTMRSTQFGFALSASMASLAAAMCPVAAYAQDADAAPADEEASDTSDIVVTGSLIRRPNNTAVSPIVTLDTSDITESGNVAIQDVLNQFPSFTTAGNAATGGQGTGGRASVNLHGLGSNRNLVLLDGRRLPISDVAGNVDINIVPESILGGVDVITGGASAIYGSDAISGVVNFRTLRNFDGVRVDMQYGISERGDAARYNGSLAFGSSFADDRGNVLVAFSYAQQDPLQGSTRSFFDARVPSSFIGTGTFVPSATNAPTAAAIQGVFGTYGITGARNPLLNLGFNNDGSLFVQTGAVNYRGPTNSNGYLVVGGNVRMPVGQQLQVLNSLERITAFANADYEVTPGVTAYGQFLYVDLTVNTESGGSLTQFASLTTIPTTNPFIPNDLRTVLASRVTDPNAPFTWNGRYVGVPDKNWDENYIVQQYLAGVRGDISSDWTFDFFASYDRSVHNQTNNEAVLKSQVQRLLNAPDGGRSLCSGGFNPFGDANARSLSPQCVDFITIAAQSRETLDQSMVQAQVNGSLFDLGAGPVQLAVLANYRRNRYEFQPNENLVAPNAFNIFAPTNGAANIEGVVNTLPLARTGISVREIAAQIDIPLLSGVPFAEELAIGAAGRISDYSVSGQVETYEFDARWRPVNSLLVRGSWQRAVRAPNIGELFQPAQGSQLVIGTPPSAIGDPCDVRSTARTGANGAQVAALCVAQGVPGAAISTYQFPTTATGQLISGNRNIVPETANTWNVGFVFDSPATGGLFGDFTLSVDYYNISIRDVISPVPGLTVLSKCYNLDGSNPTFSATNEFCQLIRRDGTGQIVNVATPFLNLGALRTDGVEVQVHWGVPTPFLGAESSVYVDSAIGWLNSFEVQLLPGAPFLDYTGVSNGGAGPSSVPPRSTPTWKALTTFGYRNEDFNIGLRWRHQSSLNDVSSVLTPANTQIGVNAYNLWDAFANWSISEQFQVRLGVTNLFDRELPFVASSQTSTDAALYDLVGRSFYIGLRANF